MSDHSLLSQVRAQCAWVAGQAEHVTIVTAKIPGYVHFLLDKYPLITAMDEPHHFSSADMEETVAYVVALDSINFGSGYFKETGLEYDVVAGGLKNAFLRGEMNTAERWKVVSAEDCHRTFLKDGQGGAAVTELMHLFALHLNETGRIIVDEYGGKVLNLIAAAENSAAKLAEILSGWKTFRDVSLYKGQSVPFLKRVQILPAHLHLTLEGHGGAGLKDMDALTIFADNMVPHVLRCDGVLEYSASLARTIDSGILIAAGSPEETELRAASIHTVELMKASALKQGRQVTSVNIDHVLWNRGYEPDIYKLPVHQTRTVWY